MWQSPSKALPQIASTSRSPLTPLSSQSPGSLGQASRSVTMSVGAPHDPFTSSPIQQNASQQLIAYHPRQSPLQGLHVSDEAAPAPEDQSLAFGEKIKKMVKCIQDLRHQGVDSTVDLPKICVVGDQSAGKSSLVQALSGIKIPQWEGTCTRCPLEVNLTSVDDVEGRWYCRVFLIQKYTLDRSASRTPQKATRAKPMGPWTASKPEKIPFAETGNKGEVHDLIRLAQHAILNPNSDPVQFQYGGMANLDDLSKNMEAKFSPNTICLDISGPGYCDLSFVDLPGVIAETALKSERFLVEVVTNLMIEHIKSQSCIIILTLPMTEDLENSNTFRLIREYNAEARTLGVLTKPDRLSESSRLSRWVDMLLGKSDAEFGYGFHTVMMQSDATLSNQQLVAREEVYFASDPWQNIQTQVPERIGIRSLSVSLEDLLSREVSKQLPNITEKINARALHINQGLAALPARPSRSQYPIILAKLVTAFGIHMKSLFGGYIRDAAANRLKAKLAFLAEAFRGALMTSRPSLTVSSTAERKLYTKFISDSVEIGSAENTTPKRKAARALTAKDDDDDSLEIFPSSKIVGVTFSLEEIGKLNQEYNATNIPNQIAPQAIDAMNKTSVGHWDNPVRELMKHVEELVTSEVMHLAADIFREYKKTQMYLESMKMITQFVEQACNEQLVEGIKSYNMEHSHPLTLDKERLAKGKQDASENLKAARLRYRVKLAEAKLNAGVANQNSKAKVKSVNKEELSLEPDPFETHIEIMANVQSYYHLAASRFADNVCQSTQAKLFAKCGREIEDALTDFLGLADDSDSARTRIAVLMSDDPERETLRNSLLDEKGRLRRAQQQLQQVLGSGESLVDHDIADGVIGPEEQLGVDVEMYDDGPAVKSEGPKPPTPRTPGGHKRRRGLDFGE